MASPTPRAPRDFAADLLAVRLVWQRSAGNMTDREVAYADSRTIERAAERAGVDLDVVAIDEQARVVVETERTFAADYVAARCRVYRAVKPRGIADAIVRAGDVRDAAQAAGVTLDLDALERAARTAANAW